MWICISLSFKLHFKNEHLFICILAIYMLSLGGLLFNFFGHYLNWVAFYFWIKIVSYIFWIQVRLSYMWSAKISFLFVGESFPLLMVSIGAQVFILMKFSLFLLLLLVLSYIRNHCLIHGKDLPHLSFKSFMVLVITFKYMNTFNCFLYIMWGGGPT